MDFNLSEEQKMYRQALRRFVQNEIEPIAEEWEEKGAWPREILIKMGKAGLLGVTVSEEYGGATVDAILLAIFGEELTRGSGGIAAGLCSHVSLGIGPIFRFGSEELKKKYVVPAVRGELLGGMALTEPHGGSDVAGIRTSAIKNGDHYILNGSKTFITNGSIADFLVVAAKVDKGLAHKDISLFVVEKNYRGFKTGRSLRKIMWHSSDTAELFFEDCYVPAENLIGREGEGFKYLMQILHNGRILYASCALGLAVAAFEEALKYAQKREVFGRLIGKNQAIQFMLADMATEIEGARWLIYRAAWLTNAGERCRKEASMAKLYASETASRVTSKAVEIFGGYGLMREYKVSRCFADAKVMEVGEGTSEMQRMIIAKELGL